MKSRFTFLLVIFCTAVLNLLADNQTATVSPIFPEYSLPFRVKIEVADFALPNGIHSGASAIYEGKWLFLAGRTNGLHGFNNNNNNFPPETQNTVVFVVDPVQKVVYTKALNDPTSGLSQHQIDLLSVTSPQSYQRKDTLYVTGGYGVDTATGLFSTKPYISAIDIPGLIHWVVSPSSGETAAQHIKQQFNSIFQITGGYMTRSNKDLTLLIFGQNFEGFYTVDSNGDYSEQVRRFKIKDRSTTLSVKDYSLQPKVKDPNYRRRDLNVVPIMHALFGLPVPAYIAFSGVFTESGGAWTVPVLISSKGIPSMENPNSPKAFKQGMNNYVCPTLSLFSHERKSTYVTFFGGISYGFFENGTFQTDEELPFINQVTTVKMNHKGEYKQYLMSAEYPLIVSQGSNPGNTLLFGAGAFFMPVEGLPQYKNGVLKLDRLKRPVVVGYIVGGIESTLPNTNTEADSAASPYIFRVILDPR